MADFEDDAMMAAEQAPAVDPVVERQKLADRLGGIVGRLQALALKRQGEREPLEQRWLEDLTQYHGRYDAKTEANLVAAEKSQLNINLTRPKTDAMSARLMDLLFPTDDKNWGIQPTPVPELTKAAEEAEAQANKLADQAKKQVEQAETAGQEISPEQQAQADALVNKAREAAEKLQRIIEEARARSELMAAEIDDQLKESNYHAVKRDQIEDACKLGTGVTKGPVTGDRIRKGWKNQPAKNPDGTPQVGPDGKPIMAGYGLEMSDGDRPAMRHVDIWSYFPDMDVRTPDEGEGTLERHLMNQKKLKGLSRLKGFDKDAIRRLLQSKPRQAAPSYLATLRNITRDKQQVTNELYHVWEYSGPLSADDMRDLAAAVGDQATLADLKEVDPLVELNAVVWFCDGELLKFSIYPYDSGECMYSVFNLVKDESSIFGYGIPSIMRDPAKSLNAAWRAMMDNAGLAAGPQVIIATELIEPADGNWTLAPRKVWKALAGLPKEHRAFETFDIPMRQVELANIITLSKQFIDDMTAMPQIAQGEQGSGVTKTAQGMALLMNSANVVFRRIVKNYDDDVTVPDLRRMYDWNMQFNPKEEIKGDYEVDARGSSVLLVREMQAQTLMAVATQLGGHPVFGPMLRNREILRKLFQALMIPSADVVLTDNEIDALLAAAAADDAAAQAAKAAMDLENRKLDIREQEIEADIQKANMDNEAKRDVAYIQRETELIKLAQTSNMGLDKLEAQLQISRDKIASDERKLAAEVAVDAANAAAARARGEVPKGSGGSVSGGAGPAPVHGAPK